MNIMVLSYRHFMLLMAIVSTLGAYAQKDEDFKYMRGSLCIMMTDHRESLYNDEIATVFKQLEIPNRFNNHDLGVRIIHFVDNSDPQKNITQFGSQKEIAKKFVSKWFDRNKNTGAFNIKTIQERGIYSATQIDINDAKNKVRGKAELADLGENLIKHTYWVVNDIQYKDKSNFGKSVSTAFEFAAGIADEAINAKRGFGKTDYEKSNLQSLVNSTSLLKNIQGFKVKITSHLYRLVWDDEVQSIFYEKYYTEDPVQDKQKVKDFVSDKSNFRLEYVGSVTNTSSNISFNGLSNDAEMLKKVCARALDKNLADLQHEYPDFRIKAPLVSVTPLRVYIGKKEDVKEKSRYEVLETIKDENGITTYKKVGIIRPIKDKIWDNQYMAELEETAESKLDGTYFEKVSGGEFLPGMLVREIK